MKLFRKTLRDQIFPRLALPMVRRWFHSISLQVDPALVPLLARPCLVACWHEHMIPVITHLAPLGYHMMVSQSHDGEMIAKVCESLGAKTVRGSSSRGGSAAVRELLTLAKADPCFRIAMTVDGPRGPRRDAKLGALYLAAWLQIPILPLGVACQRAYRLKSWDRFALPLPATRVHLATTGLLSIPRRLSETAPQALREQLSAAIDQSENLAHSHSITNSGKNLANHNPRKVA